MVDAAFFWNDVLLDAALADSRKPANQEQEGPTRTSRVAAVVHAALHDAVNGVRPIYSPYLVKNRAPAGSEPEPAAAGAAHAALLGLYPSQRTTFDTKLAQFLASLPPGANPQPSVQFGAVVAQRILTDRANDGANLNPPFTPQPSAACIWQPDPTLSPPGPPLTPHWGNVRPFTLPHGDALRPPPPPPCPRGDYAFQFNDVYVKGSDPSPPKTPPPLPPGISGRTNNETEIAIFWSNDDKRGTPIRVYNQHALQILGQEPNPPLADVLHRHARILALVNLAMADAGIACWEAKFHYNYWRPYQGIRNAGTDGNPSTQPNAKWLPLGRPEAVDANGNPVRNTTPNFPAYVSGHSSFGAAMFGMLRKFFGNKKFDFSLKSDQLPGVVHRFNREDILPNGTVVRDRFRYAADENSVSRVFLGVHWRKDYLYGTPLGQQVADHIWPNFLT